MISKLPDALISQMLSHLSTKEAVRTSVLSNRWQKLWLLIPGLDLDSSEFPDYNAFVGFMEKFLDFCREDKSCLHKLKLSIHKSENDQLCVNRWIEFVATSKLERLDVECGPVDHECLEVIPLSLYICKTLLHLRLRRVLLGKLEYNVYASEAVLESLISSCPVLEDLSIVRSASDNDHVLVVRVHSQTLTSLSVEFGWEFLTSISGVKDLNISADAFHIFSSHWKVEPLPSFATCPVWKLSFITTRKVCKRFLKAVRI